MQQHNKFNNYIKDKLEHFESPMNLEQGWGKLKAKRKEKKKKRILILCFSALFLSSMLSIFFYNNIGIETITETENKVNQEQPLLIASNINEKKVLVEKGSSDKTIKPKLEVKNRSPKTFSEDLVINLKPEVSKRIVVEESPQDTTNLQDSILEIIALPRILVSNVKNEDTLINNALGKLDGTQKRKHIEAYLRFGTAKINEIHKAKNASQNSLAEFRNQAEDNIQTMSYELGLCYSLKKNYFLNLGLIYDDWYSRFKLSQTVKKDYKFTNVVVRTITYQPNGQVDKIYGDTIVSGNQTINGTFYQRHQSFTAQLGIGKSFTHKRFIINPSLGVKYGFYNKVSGKTMKDLSNNTFDDAKNNYKNSFLGFAGNLGLAYKIKKNWAFEVNLNSSYIFSNISKSDYTLKTRVLSNRVSMGIVYNVAR